MFHTNRTPNAKMVNAQESHPTRSADNNPNSPSLASDPERIFCNSPNPSFRTVCANPRHTNPNEQVDTETFALALEPKVEGPLSIPAQVQRPTPGHPNSILKLLDSVKLGAMMRQIAVKGTGRIHTSREKKAMSNVTEEALLNPVHTVSESPNDGLKSACFTLLENVK